MPNYVSNEVMFHGNEDQIQNLQDYVYSDKRVFDFNKVIPIKMDDKKYLEPAEPLWGTKWNAVAPKISDRSEGYIQYHFETAWSPPFPIFCEIKHNFRGVSIVWSYDCFDSQFAGYFTEADYQKELKKVSNSR